jgi:hypothetical protein
MKTQTKDVFTIVLALIIVVLAGYILIYPCTPTTTEKMSQDGELTTIKASLGVPYAVDFAQDGIILEETDVYQASGTYPITGNEFIDFDFKDLIVEQLDYFKEMANANADYPPFVDSDTRYYFNSTYVVTSTSDIVKSYVFTINQYSGGAHGMQNIYTKTYNLDTQELYTIEDILVNGSADLPQLAEIVRQNIESQFSEEDVESFQDMLMDGTSYSDGSANFETFALDESSITFYFPPYQVAPYAVGTVTAYIPFSEISDIIKPEFIHD